MKSVLDELSMISKKFHASRQRTPRLETMTELGKLSHQSLVKREEEVKSPRESSGPVKLPTVTPNVSRSSETKTKTKIKEHPEDKVMTMIRNCKLQLPRRL